MGWGCGEESIDRTVGGGRVNYRSVVEEVNLMLGFAGGWCEEFSFPGWLVDSSVSCLMIIQRAFPHIADGLGSL